MKHSVDKLKQVYQLANILNDTGLHTENRILKVRDFFKDHEYFKSTFKPYHCAQLKTCFEQMSVRLCQRGEVIITAGQVLSQSYLILFGSVNACRSSQEEGDPLYQKL